LRRGRYHDVPWWWERPDSTGAVRDAWAVELRVQAGASRESVSCNGNGPGMLVNSSGLSRLHRARTISWQGCSCYAYPRHGSAEVESYTVLSRHVYMAHGFCECSPSSAKAHQDRHRLCSCFWPRVEYTISRPLSHPRLASVPCNTSRGRYSRITTVQTLEQNHMLAACCIRKP
jgi:hypothetical protein